MMQGGLIIARVLISRAPFLAVVAGRWDSEERLDRGSIAGLDGGGWGTVVQACEGPLADGKSQAAASPLEPPGRNTALPTPLSHPHETMPAFGLRISKVNSGCL